jgi:RNA polymerase sigma factor (sigma-70 family)
LDDREFIERLRGGDAGAARHLSESLLPSLWRFVYFRVHGDRHLAEDIVSETVLSLIRAVSAVGAEIVSPSAWMRGVAAHKVQDHFRAVARVQHLIDQADSVAGQKSPAQPVCEVDERRAAVRRVLDDLPDSHRLALEWKYVDRLSVQEIATRMGMTEKAVESILFRARREFREGLGVLERDDVPFRLSGTTRPLGGSGRSETNGRTSTSGLAPSDPSVEAIPVEAMTVQPAGFPEKKRQS